ncbi:hypothetical protein [Massilia sp. PAMC28688]|uniref:hypothetical protein n=1 Tax=Massilia sp. PAMC28688 TaxID=2861283 RepID=UPI001E5D3FEA|nr:hypothetical protein [Massilia sp. PAMC28688]
MPHLEALLLLRAAEPAFWNAATLAARLYIGEKLAQSLLSDLCESGMALARGEPDQPLAYAYAPVSPALRATIDSLADLYARQLVEVTHLIHSRLERKAQQFADAFKWRKDT